MFLNLGLSDIFSHDYSGAFDFQKECHRGKVASHARKWDACDPHDITVTAHLHLWLRWCRQNAPLESHYFSLSTLSGIYLKRLRISNKLLFTYFSLLSHSKTRHLLPGKSEKQTYLNFFLESNIIQSHLFNKCF